MASGAKVYGAPAEVLSYEAPMDAPALIAFLAQQYPALRDMAVFPGMAVLSDLSGPCSRVVTVSGQDGRGSRGTLSTICWEKAMTRPALPAPWLPAGAELVFDFSEPAGRAGYVQQIWQYASPPDAVARQVHGNLARQGWRPAYDPDGAGSSWQTWQRGSETVIVDILGKAAGSMLAVLRFDSGQSTLAGQAASGGMP
ncbi:MAG TPA: hypothetical protein VGC69_10880 [Bordetella sp.]